MREKDIQDWVVERVQQGDLLQHVHGSERLNPIVDSAREDYFIPAFPIDYLLRRRSAEAALAILGRLDSCALVSERRNISGDATQRLFPDLVLAWGRGDGLAAVEIKASEKPEREAVTELLAYDFELSNHLPFGAHPDRALIVIATDFSPLLEHAIGALLLWGSRSILCLRFVTGAQGPGLQVHLPSAWTRIGQLGIPSGALNTITVEVRGDAEDADQIEALVLMAQVRLVRHAERIGSHGFALVVRRREGDGARWAITVGIVDPASMLHLSLENGFLGTEANALTRWFVGHRGTARVQPPSLDVILQSARDLLDPLLQVVEEPGIHWRASWLAIRDSGIVTAADFWGALGDYAREMSLHPALSEERGGEIGISIDWQDPSFAIPFLNELSGATLFGDGFSLLSLYRLGEELGWYVATLAHASAGEEPAATAQRLRWYVLELLPSIRAISVRYKAAAAIGEPPPFVFSNLQGAEWALPKVDEWRTWFVEEFLKGQPLAQMVFETGIKFARYLEPPRHGAVVGPLPVQEMRAVVARLAREIGSALPDWVGPEASAQAAQTMLEELVGAHDATPEAVMVAVEGMPEATLCRAIPLLVAGLDPFVPWVSHEQASLHDTSVDWAWLQEQVTSAHASGDRSVGLMLDGTGRFGVFRFTDDVAKLLGTFDPNVDALVGIDEGGNLVLRRVSWATLVKGGITTLESASGLQG